MVSDEELDDDILLQEEETDDSPQDVNDEETPEH